MPENMPAGVGHNMPDAPLRVTVRLFNTVAAKMGARAGAVELEMEPGSTIADVVRKLHVPLDSVFLVLRNGRDVTPSLRGPLNVDEFLEDGDVIAFSGPVPYSAGYGAPVV